MRVRLRATSLSGRFASVVIWDVKDGLESTVIEAAPKHVYDMTLSPSGTTLITTSDEGRLRFWDVQRLTPRPTDREYRHKDVDCVQFSPEGKYLLTASDDGWLKVWDAPGYTWDPVQGVSSVEVHLDQSETLTFPDGTIKETHPNGTTEIRAPR